MGFVCYIELSGSSVPHMEALTADNPIDARAETLRLISTHASAVGATVYDGADCVAVISQNEMAA